MARTKRYSDEDVIKYAQESETMSQLLIKVGLRNAGGNYANMKRTLQRLEVDCSHWKAEDYRAWSKGKQLKDWSQYTKGRAVKPHLIKECGHQCERCKGMEWQGHPIPLEVEHVNGDRTDNRRENLLLLCCNCHALTPTWRGRNARKK